MRDFSVKRGAERLPLAVSSIAACALVTAFSDGCREGVKNGLEFCVRVLLPSLFPFMAVTGLCVRSGFGNPPGRLTNRLCRTLFGLPGEAAGVLLLSLFGGYPVGAKGIAQLYRDRLLTEEEAVRASLFAVCSGPGFMLNYVGSTLYGSASMGIIMAAAQAAAAVILGMVVGIFRKKENAEPPGRAGAYSPPPFSTALVESVSDASEAMLSCCGQVLFFSALLGSLTALSLGKAAALVFSVLLEVCSAVKKLAQSYSPEAVAFAAGFGGLCVHFQVFSLLRGVRVPKALFLLCRVIQGVLAASLTRLGLLLFPVEQAVFSVSEAHSAGVYGGSCVSAAALAVTAVCFLFSLGGLRGYGNRRKARRVN